MDSTEREPSRPKRAIVTGAASGIGLSIAKHLISDGIHVTITDLVPPEKNSGLDERLCDSFILDSTNPHAVEEFFSEYKAKHASLEVLVNNVGVPGPTDLIQNISVGEWRKTIETDINASFYALKYAIPILTTAGHGRIVNMSSAAGRLGMYGRSPYSAAKAAIIGLTKTLAIELGEAGITANAICPGAVSGPRIDGVIKDKASQLGVSEELMGGIYRKQNALGQFISPDSVAETVRFLVSGGASQITGQVYSVDGFTQKLH